MSLPTHLVDANLAAYARGDIDGLGATLNSDCTLGPLGGAPVVVGRAACQEAYAKTIEVYPYAGTRALNRIALGSVVIDHEVSLRADGARRYVATFYTVKDNGIARIETVTAKTVSESLNAAQGQLDAYNAQDLDGYMAHFASDAQIADWHGAVSQAGQEAIRTRYAAMFAEHPKNHAQLVNRIAVGPVAVDHERVRRTPDGAPFEVVAVYTLREGRIARVDFVR